MNEEKTGMRLLKKGQSGIFNLIFGRMGLVVVLLILNILLLVCLFAWFDEYYFHYFGSTTVIMIIMTVHLLNKPMDSSARTTWLIIVMLAPVFGTLMYLFTTLEIGHRMLKKRVKSILLNTRGLLTQPQDVKQAISRENPGAASMIGLISGTCGTAVCANTDVKYFPQGEDKLKCLLEELDKAEKFIYLEYFIISEGVMWGNILEILARKAAQGVDVRVMYDGTCEFILLPRNYPKKLQSLGIKCKVFSPFSPLVSTHYNYRDHRKILIIDGHTAFNGGINLSDEYINIGSRFGHWKDTAVMLKGEAVSAFTLMFLQMWYLDEKTQDYQQIHRKEPSVDASGYVMPFSDCPLDEVKAGQLVYMDLLYRAQKSVHIMTPYLILDSEVENALKYAAARGVDVKLILPGIPDKKVPYALAKSHYKALLDAGVKIYEYTPGFIHAKVVSADAREAVVGTINFDYRSFCHHFECATYMYECDCIGDIEDDFADCLTRCRSVTSETIRNEKIHTKLIGQLLKGFAPLL